MKNERMKAMRSRTSKPFKASMILLAMFFNSSCVVFTASINALSTGRDELVRYYLQPGARDIDANSLEFRNFSKYVNKMLGELEFQQVQTRDDAQIAILFSYGIGSRVAGSFSTSSGFHAYRTTKTEIVDENTRWMNLTAIDMSVFRKTKKVSEVWTVDVASTGDSDDLRYIMPMMLAACEPYIGRQTEAQIYIEMSPNDERIERIRKLGK